MKKLSKKALLWIKYELTLLQILLMSALIAIFIMTPIPRPIHYISMDGDYSDGYYTRFMVQFIKTHWYEKVVFHFNSYGGMVWVSDSILRDLKEYPFIYKEGHVSTICASACAMTIAGMNRITAEPGSALVFHVPRYETNNGSYFLCSRNNLNKNWCPNTKSTFYKMYGFLATLYGHDIAEQYAEGKDVWIDGPGFATRFNQMYAPN